MRLARASCPDQRFELLAVVADDVAGTVVALGQRAAYGAGILAGGAAKGAKGSTNPVSTALGAVRGAAGRSALGGVKARLSRAAAPFVDSFSAGAEKGARSSDKEPSQV